MGSYTGNAFIFDDKGEQIGTAGLTWLPPIGAYFSFNGNLYTVKNILIFDDVRRTPRIMLSIARGKRWSPFFKSDPGPEDQA